jgi:hypothetical protein
MIALRFGSRIAQDLDHTIICSISPIPNFDGRINNPEQATSKCPVSPSNLVSLLPLPPTLQHFDQIDDDFPYDDASLVPNTRTYFRPGAKMALKLCSILGIVHVYTAAQRTYTYNILRELDTDRSLFGEVIHRDDFPEIVRSGKDLKVVTNNMQRAILFDDRASNFKPQNYENGVTVRAFTPETVRKCYDGSWSTYLEELKEMSRLVGIALWSSVHLSGDVRKVVSYVRSWTDTTE